MRGLLLLQGSASRAVQRAGVSTRIHLVPQPERWHSPAGQREFIRAEGLPGQPSCLILCPPAHIAPQKSCRICFPSRDCHERRRWRGAGTLLDGAELAALLRAGRGALPGSKDGVLQQNLGPEVLWLSVPGLGLLLGEENPVLPRPGQHHAGLVFWARGDQGSPSASPGHGRASPEQGTRGLGGSEPR